MLSLSVEGLSFYLQQCDRFLASHINFCRWTGKKKKHGLALMWSMNNFLRYQQEVPGSVVDVIVVNIAT